MGDIILKDVAGKLKKTLRATDYLARIGSDEFMILLPETRLGEGVRVAEKVRLAVSSTIVEISPKESIPVTASMGLVNIDPVDLGRSEVSINELLSKAHFVLHQSKVSGKNKVSYPGQDPSLEIDVSEFAKKFTGERHLKAVMQPIFELDSMKESAFEFLSRSALTGFEMPEDFFRASLEAQMLTMVDHECLRTCVMAASSLRGEVRRHVNLFPSTMIGIPTKNLIETFAEDAGEAGYCLEISEQQIIGDPSYLLAPVEALRREGILIAIDDLGFGRSCLESLILLEPDIVKIDKRCVIGISSNKAAVRSLKRLLHMAASLDAEVIAEGIETQEDLDTLKSLGVRYGQGFLLGRPVASPVTQ